MNSTRKVFAGFLLGFLLLAGHSLAEAATWVETSGRVFFGSTPLCALVLINGQSMFSCNENLGEFFLEAPLDDNGAITVQVFADGFAPYKRTLPSGQVQGIEVELVRDSEGRTLDVAASLSSSRRQGWVFVSGTVASGSTPVCALVLANGQQMFSCNENLGVFFLEVPLDDNGNVKLQIFAAGFAPFKTTPDFEAGYSLAGSIVSPVVVGVDSDTNDPAAPYASNDTCSEAPTISNPISLGGYVNEAGTGEPGRSQIFGDRDDFYRVELLAGQRITLAVSDFRTGDADLYLYNSNCEIVDASMDVGEIESLTAANGGVYYVNPYAYSGATNYVLVIGNTDISSAGNMRLSNEFVPGEAIISYQQELMAARSISSHSITTQKGFSMFRGKASREMLMRLNTSTQSRASVNNTADAPHSKTWSFGSAGIRDKWDTMMAIKALRKNKSVAHAEPNYIHRANATPNDEYYPTQWHYPLINLPAAWDLERGRPGVIVAVLDSGVLLNHPDLQGQLVPGYDFVSNLDSANDGDGIDSNPDDPGDTDGINRSSFHGTHVAGTIAARTNNSAGVAGAAWGTRIMPVRVLGQFGTTYDILQGVRYAAGLPNDSNTVPAQRADIINLSLGCEGSCACSAQSQQVYTLARNAGVVIVAAAGNDSSPLPDDPAWCNGVISVSAVDLERKLSWYSNFGQKTDIAAPGGDLSVDKDGDGLGDGVFSTAGDDSSGSIRYGYKFSQGTSMAAPHVAGVFALMISANDNVTPDFIDQQLAAGHLTDELGPPGRDDSFGYGLINAQKAVTAALNLGGTQPTPDPLLVVSPSSLNFDAMTSVLEITAQNVSTGNLQLTEIVTNQSWLSVTPVNVNDSGLGSYRISADRAALPDGIYAGQLRLSSTVNTVDVPVIMTVNSVPASGDVGFIYVLLIDAATGETIAQLTPPASDGEYNYIFQQVKPGTYEIFAGTDSDNDKFICDAGEACGVYTTIDQPRLVEGNSNQLSLDFPISYVIGLPAASANSVDGGESKSGLARKLVSPFRSVSP